MSSGEEVAARIHVFPQKPDEASSPAVEEYLTSPKVQMALLDHFAEPEKSRYLNILRHYANVSILTLHAGGEGHHVWRKHLPVLARSHKFILHGMIAIGSLHLANLSSTKEDRAIYEDIAATQMNIGMSQYRIEVQKLTNDNAEALFAFTTTVTVYVLQTANMESKNILETMRKEKTSDHDKLASVQKLSHSVSRILRSMRGVLVILVPYWRHMENGPLGPAVRRDWWPLPIPVTSQEKFEDECLNKLETMWSRPERTYDYSFDTLRTALKNLRETFALISRVIAITESRETGETSPIDWGAVLTWPVHLSLEFLTLLDQHCVEAWVLMAHFAILVFRAKENIWLDGFAINLLSTAALIIGQENWNWITWPAEIVKVDLETLRNLTSMAPLSVKQESGINKTPSLGLSPTELPLSD